MATQPPKADRFGKRSNPKSARQSSRSKRQALQLRLDRAQWQGAIAKIWGMVHPVKHRHLWGSAVVVLLTVGWLRWWVVDSYWVTLPTMTPTLQVGDRLLIDKLTYQWRNPERGELVVFTPPTQDPTLAGQGLIGQGVLVNRTIGLPGDRVEIRAGQVLINDRPIAPSNASSSRLYEVAPVRVPPSTYFVMGDNPADSAATFTYGYVPRQSMVGRVLWRFFPLHRVGVPAQPATSAAASLSRPDR